MTAPRTISVLCGFALCLCACRQQDTIGFIGHLSGPGSELAVSGRDAVRLMADEEDVRVVACDTRGTPRQASECIRILADSGVRVVIGPMTSSEVDSAIDQAERSDLLLVSPTVSSHLLQGKDDPFLRVIGSNLDQADTLASLLAERGIRHPFILWESRNQIYTRAVADRILTDLRIGVDSLSQHSAGYRTGVDLSFDSMVDAHPGADAFVIAGSAMDAALLARAVARRGSKAGLYGSQFAMGSDLLRVGGTQAEGMVVAAAAPLADSTPQRRAFIRKFRERYRQDPSFGAFFSWEAAALSRAGWKASNRREAKERILSQPPQAPLGEILALDRFGDIQRRIVPHVVRSGRFEVLP